MTSATPHISRQMRRAALRAQTRPTPRTAEAYFPQDCGVNWRAVAADQTIAVVVVTKRASARRLCRQGQPAVAINGMSKKDVAALLRSYGARVIERKGLN